jgi:hypothetical protein
MNINGVEASDPSLRTVVLARIAQRGGVLTRWAVYRDGVEIYRMTQWDPDPPGAGPAVSMAIAA